MNSTEPQTKNLFLIGAGFTRAVFPHAPLNKDLFYAVVGTNPESKLSLYSKRYGTEDVEILLTRLDTDISETESNILERDRKSIEMDLCGCFAKFRFVQDKLDHNAWLKTFALEVLCEDDAIVTTNYDCFLEGLLDFCEVWSPKGGYVNVENPLLDSPHNSKNILIYKIHGSENFRMQRFADAQHKKSITFNTDENEGIFPRSAKNRHFGCIGDTGLYIVAPSFVKFPHVQIADMINKTVARAALAQNLVIGGSGLRQEDSSLWLMLTSFLNKELEIKKKLIILDQDSQRIANRLNRYWIGGTRHYELTSITSGFSQAGIKELQEALQGN